jgi:hypothetical protein
MKLSKKQKIIIWIMCLTIVFFLGLQTDYPSYYLADTASSVNFYGLTLCESSNSSNILFALGDNKYFLITAIILVGITVLLTSRKKRT